jgi:hypothetical protein
MGLILRPWGQINGNNLSPGCDVRMCLTTDEFKGAGTLKHREHFLCCAFKRSLAPAPQHTTIDMKPSRWHRSSFLAVRHYMHIHPDLPILQRPSIHGTPSILLLYRIVIWSQVLLLVYFNLISIGSAIRVTQFLESKGRLCRRELLRAFHSSPIPPVGIAPDCVHYITERDQEAPPFGKNMLYYTLTSEYSLVSTDTVILIREQSIFSQKPICAGAGASMDVPYYTPQLPVTKYLPGMFRMNGTD